MGTSSRRRRTTAPSDVVRALSLRQRWKTVVVALTVPTVIVSSLSSASAVDAGALQTTSSSDVPVLTDIDVNDFRDQAEDLDPQLAEAIVRDLEMSPEKYLAQAEVSAVASDMVEYLGEQGIDASDRRIDGMTLTIGVDSPAEARVVEALGAQAVIGELPSAPVPDESVIFESTTAVYGGDMISWSDGGGGGYRCSVGVNGTDASGEAQVLTAGHCSSATIGNGGLYRHVTIATPGFSPTGPFANLGSQRAGSFQMGGGYDAGLVRVTQSGFVVEPSVTTYNGGQGDRSTGILPVRDTIIPTTGASVCKSGATTGWTCGTITNAKVINQQVSSYFVDVFLTNVCMLGGDSGGPALIGNAVVGINSGSAFGAPPSGYTGTPVEYCATALNKLSAMAIMRHEPGVRTVETLYGATWEPTVLVDRPTVTQPGNYIPGAALTVSGTLSNATPRTRVVVTVNGSEYTAAPSGGAGSWAVTTDPITGPNPRMTVHARWGQRSVSEAVQYNAPGSQPWSLDRVDVQRISGADRYDVAIAITQRAYPGPTRPATVYVVNGADFPDALSAGAAAAATGGVVMLVPTTSVPGKILAELQRLSPQRVVIVGGPASVSEGVRVTIAGALPASAVTRISGLDRFEVSRRVLSETPQFDAATNVYIANGYDYPDALVAAAAAASQERLSPLVIVPGTGASLSGETVSMIVAEGFSSIKIAGGPGSVTESIRAQLSNSTGSAVTRLGGADRYEAARSVSNDAYPVTASTVFLTTGVNFPDALAGAPLAGLLDAPMFSVQTTCIPRGVMQDIYRLQPSQIILLGGTGTLTPAVQALTPCP